MKVDYEDAKAPFLPGEYTVVDEAHVSDLSKRGWFLVQILEETGQRPFDYNQPWECANGHSNYGNDPRCRNYADSGRGQCTSGRPPAPVVTLHRYVMRQGVNEVVIAANEETTKAKAQAQEARGQVYALKGELEKAKKEAAEVVVERDNWKENTEAARRTLAGENAMRRTLEADLAKVRKAIGDMKWKEIVGG